MLVLTALTACREPEPDPAVDGAGTPTPTPTPTVDTTSEVPLLDVALSGRCPNPREGEGYPVGSELARATLSGAGRCNDGTPPVLYVREATDPAHAADWVWMFDGGGMCTTAEGCAARWCGEDPPYGARHMSSRYAPETRGGRGIASADAENAYSGWNVVVAAYCSSDQWTGQRGAYVFEPDPAESADPPYRLYFEGDVVGRDGIAAGVVGIVSDDAAVSMPSLADADRIVVVGVSSGCQGAAGLADDVAAAAPSAANWILMDSAFYPAPEVVTEPAWVAGIEDEQQRMWTEVADPVWGMQLDPACLADHPDDEWHCFGLDLRIRGGYLGGPVLLHHDLADPVVYGFFAPIGITPVDYAQIAVDTFRLYEQTAPDVAIHANACGEHTSADADGPFLRETVIDAASGGDPWTEHAILVALVDGVRVVAVDSVPPTTSVCP